MYRNISLQLFYFSILLFYANIFRISNYFSFLQLNRLDLIN